VQVSGVDQALYREQPDEIATELSEEAACLGVFEPGSRGRQRTMVGERFQVQSFRTGSHIPNKAQRIVGCELCMSALFNRIPV
jgi:hypothetical protein